MRQTARIFGPTASTACSKTFSSCRTRVAISVAGVIEPTLRQAEIERAKRKRPDSLDAYDLYLRALPNAFAAMSETADQALPLLQQAIAIEPDYAAAHAAIAFCHEVRYIRAGLLETDKR